MADKPLNHRTFEPLHVIQPIYTGGSVALDISGRLLATCLGEDALITDLNTGEQLARIEGDGQLISTLTLTPSASHLIICSRSLSMRIYAITATLSGSIDTEFIRTVKPHATPVIVLTTDRTSTLLATGAADGLIKVWDIAGGYVTHNFKGPNVLITALHFFELNSKSSEAPNGSAATHSQRRKDYQPEEHAQNRITGSNEGRNLRLGSGNQEGKVRIWDLFKGSLATTLDSHVSDVTSLDFSAEENALLSGSRDKTIMWWDAKTWKVRKVVPVLEDLEIAGFLDDGSLVFTGGENGQLRLWQTDTGRELIQSQQGPTRQERITNVINHKGLDFLLTVRADQVLTINSTAKVENLSTATKVNLLPEIRRISGTHDEIIDLAYLLPDRSLMALATNSEELRIVSLDSNSTQAPDSSTTYFGSDIVQLVGHEEIIICLDTDWSGHWIATGAKDNTARLWRIDPENASFSCYSTFTGHAESLGAVGLPHSTPPESSLEYQNPLAYPPKFLLTGSQDLTVKRWNVSSDPTKAKQSPRAIYTRKAHDKDINAIDVNYSGQLFASASQDRTVKIWSVEEGEVQGILRGHRRGVWSVKFAPKDTPLITGDSGMAAGKGLVVTGSGDKTMKIWNLSDYSCLRTFEGHTNSILKVAWLNVPKSDEKTKRPVQVATAGGDGLVKIWDANSGEVDATLDNHEDRIWALTVHPTTNMIVSGGGDSVVTFWADTTTASQAASAVAAIQLVEQEQLLQNHIQVGSYRDAIFLALQLNHPARLLSLFTSVVTSQPEADSLSGVKAVDEVLANLTDEQLFTLLMRLRDWNTNARSAHVAQRILWTLIKSYPAQRFSDMEIKGARGQRAFSGVVDALKAYTERHYRRMEELVDESYLIEYTLQEMDELAPTSVDKMDLENDIIMT